MFLFSKKLETGLKKNEVHAQNGGQRIFLVDEESNSGIKSLTLRHGITQGITHYPTGGSGG